MKTQKLKLNSSKISKVYGGTKGYTGGTTTTSTIGDPTTTCTSVMTTTHFN